MSRKELINQVLELVSKQTRLRMSLEDNVRFNLGKDTDTLVKEIKSVGNQIEELKEQIITDYELL